MNMIPFFHRHYNWLAVHLVLCTNHGAICHFILAQQFLIGRKLTFHFYRVFFSIIIAILPYFSHNNISNKARLFFIFRTSFSNIYSFFPCILCININILHFILHIYELCCILMHIFLKLIFQITPQEDSKIK